MKEIEKKLYEICELCGKEIEKGEKYEFDGKVMCKHCLDNETLICEVCHTRIWNNDDYGDDYTNLCRNCYNEHYTRCERCNDLIHRDDANYFDESDIPYCNECYDEMEESSAIHDYGYKPEPIFYGNDKLYYGVELEVASADLRRFSHI